MRANARPWLVLLALATPAAAQIATPKPSGPVPTPKPPETIDGYVVTVEIRALAPELKTSSRSAPEAQALVKELKGSANLVSRFTLAQDISRQEILSTDFILPQGTIVLHKAGDRYYVIADPAQKTYLVMDSGDLLNALEGGAGIVNSQYQAAVQHTGERKQIAGLDCRKSVVTVSYASTIPFENDRVLVQQKNAVEVWHTGAVTSAAAKDHLFFKFQRDRTGGVQQKLQNELGFPMEVSLTVTQGTGAKKPASAQPGSFHMLVTDVKRERALLGELFALPPKGYRKVERNPYFKDGAPSSAAEKAQGR